jgi:hypothetical protein
LDNLKQRALTMYASKRRLMLWRKKNPLVATYIDY